MSIASESPASAVTMRATLVMLFALATAFAFLPAPHARRHHR